MHSLTFKIEQHTKRIVFSMLITVLYLTFYVVSNNALISFIITLNIFYFSRELLFMKLFGTSTNQYIIHENTEPMPLLKNESDVLPDNIKQMLKNTVQPTLHRLSRLRAFAKHVFPTGF